MSSALRCGLLTDHRSELSAQADAYLEELRAATAAAHDRLRAGVMRLQPQTQEHDAAFEALAGEPLPRFAEDPVFATREFDLPPQASGLVDFDADAGGIPVWKE